MKELLSCCIGGQEELIKSLFVTFTCLRFSFELNCDNLNLQPRYCLQFAYDKFLGNW